MTKSNLFALRTGGCMTIVIRWIIRYIHKLLHTEHFITRQFLCNKFIGVLFLIVLYSVFWDTNGCNIKLELSQKPISRHAHLGSSKSICMIRTCWKPEQETIACTQQLDVCCMNSDLLSAVDRLLQWHMGGDGDMMHLDGYCFKLSIHGLHKYN